MNHASSYRHQRDDEDPDPLSPRREGENSFVAGVKYLYGLQGLRIYLLVFPLCVILEMIMSASMQAVGTEYPMHMSTYCAACGTDPQYYDFKGGPPPSTTAPGAGLFEVDDFFKSCLMDQLLREFNDTANAFKDAFLNSMVGHVLMILAFQMERSTTMDWIKGRKKAANIWHIFGYVVLLADCIIEYVYIQSLEKTDPSFVKEGGYRACDGTEVTEVLRETNKLRDQGFMFAMIRSVSSGLVIICYHLSHDPEEMGFAQAKAILTDDSDNESNAKKMKLDDMEMAVVAKPTAKVVPDPNMP